MRRRFFARNLLSFLLPTMIPILLLGSFSFFIVQTSIKKEVETNNNLTLTQMRNSTELIFSEIDTLSNNFCLNGRFVSKLKTLLESDSVDYDNANIQRWFSDIINASANAKPYIHSIYVYYETNKPNMFVSNRGITDISHYPDQHWYEQYQNAENTQTFLEARCVRSYNFEDPGTPVITIYNPLYSPGSVTADGMLVMNIRCSYIEQMLSASDGSQTVFLLDQTGNLLAKGSIEQPDHEELDFEKLVSLPEATSPIWLNEKHYVVSRMSSNRYDISYFSVSDYSHIYRLPITLIRITAALLIVSFVSSVLIAWSITRKNYRQLYRTLEIFERAEAGLPLNPPDKHDAGAYDYIQQQIIRTFVEQNYLRLQLEAKKHHARSLELTALQAQINPHFLFNTLKTIFWKAVALTGSHNDVSRMIEQLSEILQYSISPSSTLVTLEEEIQNTKNYILLQKVRYQNQFEVIWEYDDELLSQKVIRLLFQPFIENAIYHGCRNTDQKCFIRIRIFLRNETLFISIIDNGAGISGENLRQIRQKLNGYISDEEMASHIGLVNTSKRLQLFYGEDACVHIASKLGFGTYIHFKIPAASNTGNTKD